MSSTGHGAEIEERERAHLKPFPSLTGLEIEWQEQRSKDPGA